MDLQMWKGQTLNPPTKGKMKPREKVKLNLEATSKFMTWMFDKYMKYGYWFDEWWKKEGASAFLTWAKNKGQEFIAEQSTNQEER